jgi:hypothetical protein
MSKDVQQDRESMSWLTCYFLRRLALASIKRKPNEETPYSIALFEVTLLVIVAPVVAILSGVLITSLKWDPTFGSQWPGFSPKVAAVVLGIAGMFVGRMFFGRRFQKYKDDARILAKFNTEADHRTVFWQKTVVLVICGLVIPLLACIITLRGM